MSETKVGYFHIVDSLSSPGKKSIRSQRYEGIRNEFEPFDVGEKVVVILESEYERLRSVERAHDVLTASDEELFGENV